jgi:hypothetical protein
LNSLLESIPAKDPRLWIKRLALFESSDKRESPLRSISFHRGLNIVWGVELPDDAGTNDEHPVTLSGHSVGKTTLCRLIRYCLGESNNGNSGAISRIKNAFPEGWVGMELVVGGQQWAVLKPIGRSGNSKAAKRTIIENLFDIDHKENRFINFIENLRSTMMSDLQASNPPDSGDRPYEWKHLLAWLTRDQEARFQSLHDWRSPRSGSDALKFQKPKEHALYLIRLVLDLVQDKELALSQSLADADSELSKLEEQITELRRVPEYRFNEQERALKQVLNLPQGTVLNIDETDWTSPIFLKRSELDQTISAIQSDIEKIDWEIAQKRIWLSSYDESRRIFRDAIAVTEEATEHPVDEDDTIRKLRTLRGKDCDYGKVPFNECSYVQQRLVEENKIIDLQKKKEDRRVATETEQRLSILNQQQKDHDAVVVLLNELRNKLSGDIARRRIMEEKLSNIRSQLQRLDYHIKQREIALDLIEGRVPNTQLLQLTTEATGLRKNIETQKHELETFQQSYGQRLQNIGAIYNDLIKNALSDTYSGKLQMPKGELQFRIEEATGLSGEAVETLALVLTDVTAMVCSCKGIGCHPRFLLHDSPREADLDRHIYNRYLQAMWTLTNEFGGIEGTIPVYCYHYDPSTRNIDVRHLSPARSPSRK